MKEDLAEGGPVPGLTVPANQQEAKTNCKFTMLVKSVNKPLTNVVHLPSTHDSTVFGSFSASYPSSMCCLRPLPALSEEDLEAIRAALRYGKLEAVVPHAPDDGG